MKYWLKIYAIPRTPNMQILVRVGVWSANETIRWEVVPNIFNISSGSSQIELPFESSIETQPSVLWSDFHISKRIWYHLDILTFWSSRHFVTNYCHSFNSTACTKVIEKFLRCSRIIYLTHIYRTPARNKTTKHDKMSKEGPTKNCMYTEFLRTSAESSRLPVT